MTFESVFVISDDIAVLNELCAGANKLSVPVTAVIFENEATAKKAAFCGADTLLYCPAEDGLLPEAYAPAIATEVKKSKASLVMINNSIRGRCIAGMIGAALDTSVLTGSSEMLVRESGAAFRRIVYGGTAVREERFTAPYGVATFSGGIFETPAAPKEAKAIAELKCEAMPGVKLTAREEKKEVSVNLPAAKRIIDVGRGLAKEEDLALCRSLAKALDAEVGCSRPVAENNKWLPKSNYMGITGVQVKPDFIITVGVSGQIQHIGGINKSKVVISINKDKNAPIFKNCDFGLVGDLYKIVPALVEKLS